MHFASCLLIYHFLSYEIKKICKSICKHWKVLHNLCLALGFSFVFTKKYIYQRKNLRNYYLKRTEWNLIPFWVKVALKVSSASHHNLIFLCIIVFKNHTYSNLNFISYVNICKNIQHNSLEVLEIRSVELNTVLCNDILKFW